mmetsp:Transcript_12628/g.22921  ORF Transcript_12628/g.22921 Transcript_12628/m.22921 type:complete len:327 (-) Transcript_12628:321-1301(-)
MEEDELHSRGKAKDDLVLAEEMSLSIDAIKILLHGRGGSVAAGGSSGTSPGRQGVKRKAGDAQLHTVGSAIASSSNSIGVLSGGKNGVGQPGVIEIPLASLAVPPSLTGAGTAEGIAVATSAPFPASVAAPGATGTATAAAASAAPSSLKRSKYMCEACRRTFAHKSSLMTHSRIHTGERPHKCKVCNKTFSQKSNLITHVRTHTGDKPHLCMTCGKRFSDKSNLISHEMIHTGYRPHVCPICFKSFCRRSNMMTHLRTHSGEKPYFCRVCGKTFTRKSNLRNHEPSCAQSVGVVLSQISVTPASVVGSPLNRVRVVSASVSRPKH